MPHMPSVLQKIADRIFGGRTRQVTQTFTVGTSVLQVLPNNPARVFWLLENESANTVRFGFSREITASTGHELAANGGVASMQADEDGESVGYEVFAIASAAGSTVRALETVVE